MKRTLARAAAALIVAVALASCEPGTLFNDQQIQAQEQFSLDQFENNIRDAFLPNSVGFSYVIVQNGQVVRSDAVGLGRTTVDGERDMALTDRMHIASVSKTITTAAVLRLIEDTPEITLGSSVNPYFPSGWDRHVSIGFLTFRNLLSHASGIDFTQITGGPTSDNNDDASLQEVLRAGTTLTKIPRYANQHHALLRIVVANVLNRSRIGGETDAEYHSRVFGEYVQEVVFDRASIPTVSTQPPPSPNLYYAWPDGGLAGVGGATDFSTHYGAYGWYLSAIDLGTFLATLRFTEDILSEESRLIMDSEELGYWNTREGENGTYLMKQGGWVYTTNPLRQGLQTVIANFTAGVQAAVIVNSRPDDALFGGDGGFNMASVMRDAFDDAFVEP